MNKIFLPTSTYHAPLRVLTQTLGHLPSFTKLTATSTALLPIPTTSTRLPVILLTDALLNLTLCIISPLNVSCPLNSAYFGAL